MLRPTLLALTTAVVAAGAVPAAAGATDFCVKTDCGGTDVPSLQQALSMAADSYPGADRIFLGEGTFTDTSSYGFEYAQAYQAVEIIGKGTGQTILTGKANGGGNVLALNGAAGSSVHDLTIRIPENADPGFVGLENNAVARRVEVIEHPTQANYRTGVLLRGGARLEDSTVTLDDAQATTAVNFSIDGGIVRRSALAAQLGVASAEGGTIERSRVTGSMAGVEAFCATTTITESVIRFGGPGHGGPGNGIFVGVQDGTDTAVHADGVTLVGAGEPGSVGVHVGLDRDPAQHADVVLTNSIVRGAAKALSAWAQPTATGHAKIATAYSDYDPSGNVATGAKASITQTNATNDGDAKFADAAAGDYRLLPGSPLIDAGDPAAQPGLDLAGNPLVADGDGDGAARRDLGAFELPAVPAAGQGPVGGEGTTTGTGASGGTQGSTDIAGTTADTQAPLLSGFRATPSRFAIARKRTPVLAGLRRGTRFRYTLSEPARVTLEIQRRGRRGHRTVATLRRTAASGTNGIRFTGRIGKRALRPGRYRATLTATDTAGNRSLPRATRFRITRG